MKRSAVFVDAGYLYAQGSAALAGRKLERDAVKLDLAETVTRLCEVSCKRTGDAPLLRIYWYDGLLRGRQSPDQQRLAFTENVKLRLGIVNEAGQQKGVDSLIVTDLVELARNHAITDAVLLSGDEHLRIGVQIAQSFGVRVHLIGIEPSRGSQSHSLLQEADTTTEWSKPEIGGLMALNPGFDDPAPTYGSAAGTSVERETTVLKQAVGNFVSSLHSEELRVIDRVEEGAMIPSEFDRKLLKMCGDALGKELYSNEKFQMRQELRKAVRDRLESL